MRQRRVWRGPKTFDEVFGMEKDSLPSPPPWVYPVAQSMPEFVQPVCSFSVRQRTMFALIRLQQDWRVKWVNGGSCEIVSLNINTALKTPVNKKKRGREREREKGKGVTCVSCRNGGRRMSKRKGTHWSNGELSGWITVTNDIRKELIYFFVGRLTS